MQQLLSEHIQATKVVKGVPLTRQQRQLVVAKRGEFVRSIFAKVHAVTKVVPVPKGKPICVCSLGVFERPCSHLVGGGSQILGRVVLGRRRPIG